MKKFQILRNTLNTRIKSLTFHNFKQFTTKIPVDKIDYAHDTRDFLNKVEEYESNLNDREKKLELNEDALPGHATDHGTEKYSNRNREEVVAEHFKKFYFNDLTVSTIGLGTYIGPPDDITDFYMYNAVKYCVLSGGVNLIDTAINYRYMKSERAVGKALKTLCSKYDYDRNELIICSKVGYVPEDAESGKKSHAFVQHLVEGDKISMEDIIFDDKKRPVHCMHPEFLKEQLNLSLQNLGLSTIDVMYLHNVVESQGAVLPKDAFDKRLAKAFEFMEEARKDNKIKAYGMATWSSFRTPANNPGLHSNLQEIVALAEKVGGANHGFRFLQVPINIMHPEAFVENYQNFNHPDKGVIPVTLTAACTSLKINLISCSPLMQGYINNLPMENVVFNVKHNASKHLQLIRSVPAECLKSTLVGMKTQSFIKSNLELLKKPPLTLQQFYEIMAPKKRQPFIEKEV